MKNFGSQPLGMIPTKLIEICSLVLDISIYDNVNYVFFSTWAPPQDFDPISKYKQIYKQNITTQLLFGLEKKSFKVCNFSTLGCLTPGSQGVWMPYMNNFRSLPLGMIPTSLIEIYSLDLEIMCFIRLAPFTQSLNPSRGPRRPS